MLKWQENKQNIFFGFSLFFSIFGFFWKYIKNMGQKLGSNNHHFFMWNEKNGSVGVCGNGTMNLHVPVLYNEQKTLIHHMLDINVLDILQDI